MAEPSTAARPVALRRGLGTLDAVSLTIGSVVGTGIFLAPADLARALPAAPWMLAAWAAGGALTLAGALTYAELGAMLPAAGGLYVYLREAWGPLWGFLYGWVSFGVIMGGGIAAIAVGCGEYFGALVPAFASSRVLAAAELGGLRWELTGAQAGGGLAILALTLVNHFGLRAGATLQNLLTFAKVAALAAFAVGAWLVPAAPGAGAGAAGPVPLSALLAGASVAMIAVLWSYDGWYAVTFSAGELRDPARALPRGLIGGTVAVALLYLVVQLAYLRGLSVAEIGAHPRVAQAAAAALFGSGGGTAVAAVILVAMLGCLAATILYSSRIYGPMAADGVFFRALAHVDPRTQVPTRALWTQSAWAVALALSGGYRALYTWVTFVAVVFHAIVTAGIFVLRRRRPELARPFRVPLWPWTPVVFLAATLMLAAATVLAQPVEAGAGLLLTAAGLPAYAYWRRRAARTPLRTAPTDRG